MQSYMLLKKKNNSRKAKRYFVPDFVIKRDGRICNGILELYDAGAYYNITTRWKIIDICRTKMGLIVERTSCPDCWKGKIKEVHTRTKEELNSL